MNIFLLQWKSGRVVVLFLFLSVLILSVCFCSFGVIAGNGDFPWHLIICNFVKNVPAFLLMAWLDYKILTRSLGIRDTLEWFILWLLAATVSAPLLLWMIVYAVWMIYPFQFNFFASIIPGILCNAIIVLLISIYIYGKRQMENQQRLACMEREKMLYQFEALKNQINPHFLFNSLNVLASLAYQRWRKIKWSAPSAGIITASAQERESKPFAIRTAFRSCSTILRPSTLWNFPAIRIK